MAITPAAGYIVDPANPNAVIRDPGNMGASTALSQAQLTGGTTIGNVNKNPILSAVPPATPPPAPNAPPATSAAPPAQPQGTTSGTSPASGSAPQGGAQGTLTMPANGSVVDLLNMAGQDSSMAARQELAKQFGIQGYKGTAAQNTELAKKYLDAYNANKSAPAPENAAQASSALDTYFKDNAPASQENPQASFIDNYAQMNPVVKQMYDAVNQAFSSTQTRTSFAEEYKNLLTEQGVPGLRTELMNIRNVMDGTEDDIRTEITKAGGFATESQIQGMVAARNKVLMKQAQSLQDQLQMKEDYVDQIMQFTKLDRDTVDKEVETKLGLLGKMADIQIKMSDYARDNYNRVIDKVGYSGLIGALGNNVQAQAQAEKILGLPAGSLSPGSSLSTFGGTGKILGSASSGYFELMPDGSIKNINAPGAATAPGAPAAGEPAGASDGYKFSQSNLQTGAANAGMMLEDFNALPGEIKNLFIKDKKSAQYLLDVAEAALDGEMTAKDAFAEIDEMSVSDTVKQFFKSKIPVSRVESKTPFESTAAGIAYNTITGIPGTIARGASNLFSGALKLFTGQ